MTHTNAYYRGYDDAKSGVKANPYVMHTQDFDDWEHGFEAYHTNVADYWSSVRYCF